MLGLTLTAQDVHVKVNQDLIKLTNGESFFTEIQSVKDGVVTYQKGPQTMTVPVSDIALIEFKETGVEYFNKNTLKIIDPKTVGVPVCKKGNKVYIPFSSHFVPQRSGALRLRELIVEDGFWEAVDCVEEAHFILELSYSEKGRDNAVVYLKDRSGNLLYETSKSGKGDWNDVDKGIKMAESLHKQLDIEEILYHMDRELCTKISARKKGFTIRPEVSAGYPLSISPSLTFAYQFSPHFTLGAGAVLGYKSDKSYYYGAYANPRVYFCDRPLSPYFDVRVGYGFFNVSSSHNNSSKVGAYMRATLGLQYKLIDFSVGYGFGYNTGLCVNIGYNIQFAKKK